jgi:hypothetical protein
MKGPPRVTARTRTRWRNAASTCAVCLVAAGLAATVWYRATYHVFPGMVPAAVHWCGRDYQTAVGGTQDWAQITAAERPRQVRVVGSYPPLFGWSRPLLAAPGTGPARPGQVCAMIVYIRTGPGRYQPYALEGGP